MTRLRIWLLQWRAMWIEAQIDHGLALLNDHQRRLDACHKELRRIKMALGKITPAHELIAQIGSRK